MLALLSEIKAAFAIFGVPLSLARGAFGVLGVLGNVLATIWGVTTSAKNSLNLADLKHIVVVTLTFLAGGLATGAKVFAFSSMVFGDLGAVNAAISGILAGLAAAVLKWVSGPAPTPKPVKFIQPNRADLDA